MALKAVLQIQTALREEKTFLKKSFCTPPFKLADIKEDKKQNALQLMLRTSSPGILDGDEYRLEIDLAEGCSLHLQTQSYQRIFQMKHGASQRMDVWLAKGASFRFLPHPSVPHAGAVFVSKNKIHLSKNCTLTWGEVLSCGRKLNGEVFRFSSYHSTTEIFMDGKLVVKENLLLQPAIFPVQGIGIMEGYSHQGTLIYLSEEMQSGLIETIADSISAGTEIVFGISRLPVSGFILRLLGHKAEALFHILNRATDLIAGFPQKHMPKPITNVV